MVRFVRPLKRHIQTLRTLGVSANRMRCCVGGVATTALGVITCTVPAAAKTTKELCWLMTSLLHLFPGSEPIAHYRIHLNICPSMGIGSTLTSLSLLLLLHFSEFCTCKCSQWKNEGGWNETGEWKKSENLNLLFGSYLLCCCRCCVLLPFNNSPLH